MFNKLRKSRILITGGTGSFGSQFLSTLLKLKTKPKQITIFSRDEKKQFDMRNTIKSKIVNFVIGDVRDYENVLNIMENIDYVFHAAALKQVPSCEFFPIEAVKTNILGTDNIIKAANRTKVKKVIFLSTDKSVQPINAMGMSKALMEKTVSAKSKIIRKNLSFCITRYGNVIGSRGSVVPTFIEQIKKDKKLTITDPKMTRFMMTLDDAVKLVFYAFEKGNNGDIFIKKSPASDILNIAKAVSNKFKKRLRYEIIGTRLGEKIHETLLSSEEMAKSKDLGSFYKINPLTDQAKFNDYFYKGNKLKNITDYSSNNTQILNLNQTIKILEKSEVYKN